MVYNHKDSEVMFASFHELKYILNRFLEALFKILLYETNSLSNTMLFPWESL